jgi:hypothetical protein
MTSPVGFAITAPVGILEHLASAAVGGLGAAHQAVTQRAWHQVWPLGRDQADEPDARALVAGVIYNDFPWGDELDAERRYVATVLEPIKASDAPYMTDPRFMWQPTQRMRWALAALYKHWGGVLRVAGVPAEDVERAREALATRTLASHTCYHFMRATRAESDGDVVAASVAAARRWFRQAVVAASIFPLGHIVHMIEDSFSPAHTDRDLTATIDAPYGHVRRIYFFGDQNDSWHSERESIDAVLDPTKPAGQAAAVAARAVAEVLRRYVAAVRNVPRDSAAEQVADEFAEFLRTKVFRLAP